MYVACSTQCFARLPLERALRLMAELEFSKVDVAISEFGTHPPLSLAALFRHHLRLLGDRPARWTAVPVT